MAIIQPEKRIVILRETRTVADLRENDLFSCVDRYPGMFSKSAETLEL